MLRLDALPWISRSSGPQAGITDHLYRLMLRRAAAPRGSVTMEFIP